MQQVSQNIRNGKLSLMEAPDPVVLPGQLLVANARSVISAGTEKMVTELAKKSLLGKARERPDPVRRVREKLRNEALAGASGPLTCSVRFNAGRVAVIHDFSKVETVVGGKTSIQKLLQQDKSHRAEIAAFTKANREGGPPPIGRIDIRALSAAAILAVQSLSEGVPFEIR